MDISDFIKHWTETNNLTPTSVNNGWCEDFAQALEQHLPGSRMQYIEEFFEFASPECPGNHIWVLYQGRVFDSETPTGVDHWSELPFYKRIASRVKA